MDDPALTPADSASDVNKQLYERNVELAIRNRTLSALRKMYEIINSSLGVEETAKKLIEAIVVELQFKDGIVALYDKNIASLRIVASSTPPELSSQTESLIGKSLTTLSIPISNTINYCVKSYQYKQRMMTNFMIDILTPLVDEKVAEQVQEALGIKTSFVFPLTSAIETSGVLVLGMDKHVGDLSRAEREIIRELIDVVSIGIDRAKVYEDLKEANLKLVQLDKQKDEFVSLASHELRTPMTAIRSYLWLAIAGKGGPLTDKQKYYLDRSYSSTVRLIKLVNDMLNISRIESGRITLELADVDLGNFIDEVIGEVKPRADEVGIEIDNKYDKTNPLPHVLADPDKIKEVMINLIGNSLKFTPKGGKVAVSAFPKDGQIAISVSDTGVGLASDDLTKLFQKFGFLKESYTTNQNAALGTGLGLYISKSIIDLHGGKIWVESAGVGQGATFTFTLKVFNQQELDQSKKSNEGKEGMGIIPSII